MALAPGAVLALAFLLAGCTWGHETYRRAEFMAANCTDEKLTVTIRLESRFRPETAEHTFSMPPGIWAQNGTVMPDGTYDVTVTAGPHTGAWAETFMDDVANWSVTLHVADDGIYGGFYSRPSACDERGLPLSP